MLRVSSRIPLRNSSKVVQASRGRLQSTYSGGGGGPNKVVIGAAGATSVLAGVVGYASWSPENRRGVENIIPGSSYILGPILGPAEAPELPKISKPEPKIKKQDVGLVRKRLDKEKKKKEEEEPAAVILPAPAPELEPPVLEASKDDSQVVEEKGDSITEIPSDTIETPTAAATDEVTESASVEVESANACVGGLPAETIGAETTGTGLTIITTGGKSADEPAPAPTTADVTAGKETVGPDLEHRLASGEIFQDVENVALVETIDDITSVAQKQVTSALSAAEEAAIIIRKHAERAYQAIDAGQDKESLFAAVAELSAKRAEVTKVAEEKINEAAEAVEQLKELIVKGYASKLTKGNPKLISADESLGDLKYAVDKTRSIITDAQRDGKIISDYRDLVDSGREQFETEIRSLLPEVKLGETGDKLSRDELNLLIAHAHRKVLQLQKQIARLQSIEHERFKEALDKQREEDSKILDVKIASELDKQNQTLEIEYKKKMAHLQEELEVELRAQLKRQAAAHSDHLADVLTVQEKELETKWSIRLDDEVQQVKTTYLTNLSKMQGQLDGLKSAMTARADVDKAAYAARQLWLACDSLRNALRLGTDEAKSWEEQLKPLNEHVSAIKVAGGDSNPFIDAVVNSIPEQALSRGVFTEEAIRERFLKVERLCKRVSMIGDNGGSLIRYFISYIRSFLILNAFEAIPGSEIRNEAVAVDNLDTYDILARAKYCMDKDDLPMSVRYMNLLRGEPRNVASGWLKEARLTLEARQAADALLAHAAATAVKAG